MSGQRGMPPADGHEYREYSEYPEQFAQYPEYQQYAQPAADLSAYGYAPQEYAAYSGDGYEGYDAHPTGYAADTADAFGPEAAYFHPETTPETPAEEPEVVTVPAPREGRAASRRRAVPGQRGGASSTPVVPLSQRVPIWHPPGVPSAMITAGLAVLLAVAAVAGRPATVAAVVVLQAFTAAGWFRLNGMWPARQGIAVAFASGLGADVVVYTAGDQALHDLPGVLAVMLLLTLAQQVAGARGGAVDVLPALVVGASAALVTVVDSLYVVAAGLSAPGMKAGAPVAVCALAVAAAVLVVQAPLPSGGGSAAGVVAAVLVGAAGASVTGLAMPHGVMVGAAGGTLGLLGRRVSGYDHPSRFVHMTAGVVLPLVLAAPVAYMLGRVAVG